jgi:hypothetical protein
MDDKSPEECLEILKGLISEVKSYNRYFYSSFRGKLPERIRQCEAYVLEPGGTVDPEMKRIVAASFTFMERNLKDRLAAEKREWAIDCEKLKNLPFLFARTTDVVSMRMAVSKKGIPGLFEIGTPLRYLYADPNGSGMVVFRFPNSAMFPLRDGMYEEITRDEYQGLMNSGRKFFGYAAPEKEIHTGENG